MLPGLNEVEDYRTSVLRYQLENFYKGGGMMAKKDVEKKEEKKMPKEKKGC
jgi:hypothetical protein